MDVSPIETQRICVLPKQHSKPRPFIDKNQNNPSSTHGEKSGIGKMCKEKNGERSGEKKGKIKRKKNRVSWKNLAILFLFSCMVRTYRIEKGAFVLWDEAHFGKFATHYLKREYFFDVHPPLGKMLTAFSAWIHSVPSGFAFPSGLPYPLDVDYCGMRLFHAVFGSAVPVLGGILMQNLQYDTATCLAVGVMLAMDNAFVSVSRLVLLDVFLLFFMGVSEIFLSRMVVDNRLISSWPCLLALGCSLGLTMSVKWIGCFTVAHTGAFVIYTLVLEARKRSRRVFSMFARYFLTLVCVPIAVYLAVFFVHLLIVCRTGPGDGEMSSWFQQFLSGNELHKNDKTILYGNKITVRCSGHAVGLLHSHKDTYPNGRQQVTTYPHKDGNNHWRVLKVGSDPKDVRPREDLVLHHQATDAYLAVEDEPSFLSGDRVAVCLSQKDMGNAITSNCVFQVIPSSSKDVKPASTYFYIWNTSFRCYLSHSGKKLPKWGHSQGEVYCTPEKSKASLWNVEMNREKEDGETARGISRSNSRSELPSFTLQNFLGRVLELNMAMHAANSALVDNGEDKMGSVPLQWMFPKKWLKFNTWDGSVPRFALLGNPLTWYTASANVLFLGVAGIWGYFFVPTRESISIPSEKHRYNTKKAGRMYVILGGWLFHYLPFFLMARILYLHHYLCSLFFSVAGLGAALGCRSRFLLLFFTFCSAVSFLCFSQLTYGSSSDLTRLFGRNLFPWNIYSSAE